MITKILTVAVFAALLYAMMRMFEQLDRNK